MRTTDGRRNDLTLWWAISNFAPHSVFIGFSFLSTISINAVTKVAFWSWLALVALDELSPRVEYERSSSGDGPSRGPHSEWIARKVVIFLFILFLVCQIRLGSTIDPIDRDFVVLALTTGFLGSIFAIPIAHELMHGQSMKDRRWAVLVMAMFSYPHFCLEHMYGHHRYVATPADPATARRGESIYRFWGRAIFGSLLNAWRREIARANVRRFGRFSMANRIIQYLALVMTIYIIVFSIFGVKGVLMFALQSVTGILTLEAINYVEHYGLERQRTDQSAYEPIGLYHSWSSTHFLTNILLFDLARHGEHHVRPNKKFRTLTLDRALPLLPVGYFGILWLALFPPLWCEMMDSRIRQLLETTALEQEGG